MSEPMTPARRAEIAAECAPIIPHPDTSGGHFSLPGAKDYIRGLWHEDGGTYYIRCPESLRPALMTMLNTFPDLLAEVARLEAEVARLRAANTTVRNNIVLPLVSSYGDTAEDEAKADQYLAAFDSIISIAEVTT